MIHPLELACARRRKHLGPTEIIETLDSVPCARAGQRYYNKHRQREPSILTNGGGKKGKFGVAAGKLLHRTNINKGANRNAQKQVCLRKCACAAEAVCSEPSSNPSGGFECYSGRLEFYKLC